MQAKYFIISTRPGGGTKWSSDDKERDLARRHGMGVVACVEIPKRYAFDPDAPQSPQREYCELHIDNKAGVGVDGLQRVTPADVATAVTNLGVGVTGSSKIKMLVNPSAKTMRFVDDSEYNFDRTRECHLLPPTNQQASLELQEFMGEVLTGKYTDTLLYKRTIGAAQPHVGANFPMKNTPAKTALSGLLNPPVGMHGMLSAAHGAAVSQNTTAAPANDAAKPADQASGQSLPWTGTGANTWSISQKQPGTGQNPNYSWEVVYADHQGLKY